MPSVYQNLLCTGFTGLGYFNLVDIQGDFSVRAEGIEPSTFPLSEECSTTELRAQNYRQQNKCNEQSDSSKNEARMLGFSAGLGGCVRPRPAISATTRDET